MKKKKIIKIILILLIVAVVMTGGVFLVLMLNGTFSQKLANGRYYIQNNDKYKDAYIEVKGDQIQFHNIDLNEAFLPYYNALYEHHIERSPEDKLSDEDYKRNFDFNRWLADEPYTIEYSDDADNKLGTYTYYHYIYNGFFYTTVVIHYDSWNKTIKIICKGDYIFEFKKKSIL